VHGTVVFFFRGNGHSTQHGNATPLPGEGHVEASNVDDPGRGARNSHKGRSRREMESRNAPSQSILGRRTRKAAGHVSVERTPASRRLADRQGEGGGRLASLPHDRRHFHTQVCGGWEGKRSLGSSSHRARRRYSTSLTAHETLEIVGAGGKRGHNLFAIRRRE